MHLISLLSSKRSLVSMAVLVHLALFAQGARSDALSDVLRRQSQTSTVQQAVYQLVYESYDSDSDGTIEPAAMKASGAGPSDGGVVPDASGAPKTDGFGGVLGYCSWDNGTTTVSAGRLPGGTAANKVALAVVSYGLDNTFQTTCADLSSGVVIGDDYAFWMTSNQLASGQSTSVSPYWGAPVANSAALLALDTATLHDGEIRVLKDSSQLWRYTTGTGWVHPTSGAINWVDSGSDVYTSGKAAIGQASVGAEALVVNGGATSALGLKGTAATTGVSIYNTAGSAVNAFLGYDNVGSNLLLSAQTGALSVQLGGSERMRVAADGSLALNGVTVFDSSRNLTAGTGTFSGAINTTGAYQVGGIAVLDAGRNLTNIASLTTAGVANVGALQVGGVTVVDGARSGSLSSLTTSGGITATGGIQANGGINTTVLTSTGQIIGPSGTVGLPSFAFTGSTSSGFYSPLANTVAIATSGTERLRVTSTGNILVGTTTDDGSNKLQVNGAVLATRLIAYGAGGLATNSVVGEGALTNNTTGNYNTASGSYALYANTTGFNNTASGYRALVGNTTGNYNTASGGYALYANTTGNYNTASGGYALYANTTGSDNTASGALALRFNTTGYQNTASGSYALYSNTTGYNNTASGGYALYANTTGSNNTASGALALQFNTTGYQNTASGAQALQINTTGYQNTASGALALNANTTGFSNTASGALALNANTTGFSNTASGAQALQLNTTGYGNTASGYRVLYGNTTGYQNTGDGVQALYDNTTGYNNTASGAMALRFNTTGFNNTASGGYALYSNTTGYQNTASGVLALQSSTTGFNNTASGYQALRLNTTGFNNTANGAQALYSNTTGYENTAHGVSALQLNTTGYQNTSDGNYALYSNLTGFNNSASGYRALYSSTTGYSNAAIGYQALYGNTTGYRNTAIGLAGYNPSNDIAQYRVTGDTNLVLLGYGATKNNAALLDNSIAIGANAWVTQSNQVVLGSAAVTQTVLRGNVLVGTTIDDGVSRLQVNGGVTATTFTGALLGNATTATTATHVAGGTAGSLPYQTGAGATAMLGIGAANTVLVSSGATPTWVTPTGTGSPVFSAGPVFTGTVSAAALTTTGNVAVGAALTVAGATTLAGQLTANDVILLSNQGVLTSGTTPCTVPGAIARDSANDLYLCK